MSIPVVYSKEELLAALEAKRPAAEKADKHALAEHKKAEQAYLAKFRERLREALKWDYAKAKEARFNVSEGSGWSHGPSCPQSRVHGLNIVIASVQRANVARFTVKADGKYKDVYQQLMADVPKPEMC